MNFLGEDQQRRMRKWRKENGIYTTRGINSLLENLIRIEEAPFIFALKTFFFFNLSLYAFYRKITKNSSGQYL